MATPLDPVAQQAELLERVLACEVRDMDWIDRRASRDGLLQNGLPYPGKGRWQYTNINTLIETSLEIDGRTSAALELDQVDSIEFESARANVRYDTRSAVADSHDLSLVHVNGLLFRTGAILSVEDQEQNAIVKIGNQTNAVDRYDTSIGTDASVQLLESFEGGNRTVLFRLGERAKLDYSLQSRQSDNVGYHAVVVSLMQGAQFRMRFASSGGSLHRHDIVVNALGSEAESSLQGGWLLHDQSHLDVHTIANHQCGFTSSDQSFHGVVDDRARASFNGTIKIQPNATSTEAHLVSRNVSLSPLARANAQPDLEIYTDDVICSHGVTCGRLNEDELFLLRSRGIDETVAERLLVQGFLNQVVPKALGEGILTL